MVETSASGEVAAIGMNNRAGIFDGVNYPKRYDGESRLGCSVRDDIIRTRVEIRQPPEYTACPSMPPPVLPAAFAAIALRESPRGADAAAGLFTRSTIAAFTFRIGRRRRGSAQQ